jgi:hypothetical protein
MEAVWNGQAHLAQGRSPYARHRPEETLDFLARLAVLVPSPGVNLTRYHGLFAPNHGLRAQIVPAKRGRGAADTAGQGSATPKHVSMSWAQRLKRVFGIEIQRCDHCGGAVKIIASTSCRSLEKDRRKPFRSMRSNRCGGWFRPRWGIEVKRELAWRTAPETRSPRIHTGLM